MCVLCVFVVQVLRLKPELMLSNVETTVAAKLRQLQELFPEGDVVSMVESDPSVTMYDYENNINVKVNYFCHCMQEPFLSALVVFGRQLDWTDVRVGGGSE